MSTFVDTSAFLALLDADDTHHTRALAIWNRLADEQEELVTSDAVLIETIAVAQHRLGLEAVRAIVRDVLPVIRVHFGGEEVLGGSLTALIAAGRRHLSLADCMSFELMRRHSILQAFAFDRHFTEMGFECVEARRE